MKTAGQECTDVFIPYRYGLKRRESFLVPMMPRSVTCSSDVISRSVFKKIFFILSENTKSVEKIINGRVCLAGAGGRGGGGEGRVVVGAAVGLFKMPALTNGLRFCPKEKNIPTRTTTFLFFQQFP